MESIALFGGSFDPPHIGHVAVVNALQKLEFIDEIILMPTFLNPFKKLSHAPSELRLKWLKKIFSSYKNVKIDDYEVKQNRQVPSIESVKYLLKKYKKIYLVIGADNIADLPKWNSYEELSKLVTFIVAPRGDIKIPEKFLTLDLDAKVSSSYLRKMMDAAMLPECCAVEIIKYYKEKNAT
ncbi:MAG: nicotinate (nicotinamide) nucleotide adenylyltransferase [Sulfurimonas sp.]|nr:nicotinate (nicotinamide) nucleotide adenylyltransferase [Sulfurimonas sp.]MBU3938717.1 nicotinate (nicotinamide) nucleotide adenylyltransferase [bacterium]MBU4024415.1 nicotinate (nicotinamide) nucleotide adenylyltransferase [bacterium]MBU4057985.1 nicotinate (nicotinamide) nucleotide adenylyltransferase [bacterium]MBU4109854.1 nicotinate (nicotinamide) nucleotide adenylyltransferase [bacterium]